MESTFMFQFLLVCEGCLSIISNYFEQYGLQAIYGILTGMYMSISVLTIVPAISRITGIFTLSNAIGYMLIFQGIGIMVGTLVCGPIAGGVCNRFGFRMTNMLGCFLMILGLVSSYFISDYFSFLLFYGITCGCGTSFILMVANVATGFWFDSKRTIAFGLVSASGGISVFSVPLSNYLADEYGWRHCFSIWAGLVVILLLGSFLLAPPPMIELESNKPLVGPANTVDIKRVTIIIPLEYEKPKVQRMTAKKIHKMSMTTGIPMGRVSRASVRPAREPIGLGKIFRCCLCCNCCTQSVGSRPLYRKDIFYEGSICYAAKKENQDETTFPLTMTKLPTTRDVAQEVECHCALPEAVSRALKEMLDFSLFKSPIFFLILLSSFVVYIVRYIPLLVLKKFNLPYMDNVTANKVITMFGLGSLISRALVGFILYYFHHISPLIATIFVTLIGGMALCCLIITHWEIYQMVLSFVAGSFVAVVISIRSLVIIDLLGLNKLTSCTGLLFFLQGFASFVGMPIADL
ncbi:unnamed protein product [Nezara viridula]|uniref:Monocarboxylate transporter n=1 Tax=Nezara viridula TaxID=85310 RepID=A0A9P0GWM4_NEZVI|nr:unnamed protein product [Nezara viridula]